MSQTNSYVDPVSIGVFSPEQALEYMKNTENLFIIDVASSEDYEYNHFEGAVNIPWAEMRTKCKAIPAGVPVLLHCRKGNAAPKAFKILKEKRPDIEEVHYIAGIPPFEEYNEWLMQ